MKKFFVIVPAILALGGCLQGGDNIMAACSDASSECVQAALADMATAPDMDVSVPGEANRDGRDTARSRDSAGVDGRSDAGPDQGAGDSGASAGGDDATGADDDGNGGNGDKGKKGKDRNQNAIDKGDNRDDKARNADDARR